VLGLNDEATASAVRTIEKAAMEREDAYRRAWLRERGQSGGFLSNPASNALPVQISSKKSVAGHAIITPIKSSSQFEYSTPSSKLEEIHSSLRASLTPTSKQQQIQASQMKKNSVKNSSGNFSSSGDVSAESAVAFVTSSQRFYLADRYVRKEYFWKVSAESFEGKQTYVLKWRDLEADSVVGHIFLNDVQGILMPSSNPCQLDLSIGTSSKALLGTGGRAVVSMIFTSELDCKKYGKCLKVLQGI
jgi:hypothetical protein